MMMEANVMSSNPSSKCIYTIVGVQLLISCFLALWRQIVVWRSVVIALLNLKLSQTLYIVKSYSCTL